MIKQNFKLAFRAQFQQIRLMSTAEIREILAKCEMEPKLHLVGDVVRVIANTGIRNSELMSLRMSDVDITGGWLTIKGRKVPFARKVPLRPKTIAAIISLHKRNPESVFVLGEFPIRRMRIVIALLWLVWPRQSNGRSLLLSVRLNFKYRLMSAGIPSGVVRYCAGSRDPSSLLSDMSLTPEEWFDIVRRNLERFLEEL
jgi:integrase